MAIGGSRLCRRCPSWRGKDECGGWWSAFGKAAVELLAERRYVSASVRSLRETADCWQGEDR
jgi:hypothetical protein